MKTKPVNRFRACCAALIPVAGMMMLVAGCLLGHRDHAQLRSGNPEDLGSMIESAVNDRSTWVDPVHPF